MDADRADKIIFGFSITVLFVGMSLLSYSFGHERGFKKGVIAAWECHTDMECENLEEMVR